MQIPSNRRPKGKNLAVRTTLQSDTTTKTVLTAVRVPADTEGATGELLFYAPIPIFAVGCTVATMTVR